MNKETIEKLENLFSNLGDNNPVTKCMLIMGMEAGKVGYAYRSYFTHPQILPNEMLYIGHFLSLPFCLDLGCPGAVHVLTGDRTGMVDEWDWYGSFGEALRGAQKVEEEKLNELELERQNDVYWDWPE